ncbi:hypothetical protein GT044_39285, partial [Streptomyces sp. SID335]|uniref:hypothetical protein n=1 Tax=Streptomyces sp. SID335 TaxID=2690261 RepID=UPI001370C6E6
MEDAPQADTAEDEAPKAAKRSGKKTKAAQKAERAAKAAAKDAEVPVVESDVARTEAPAVEDPMVGSPAAVEAAQEA